MPFVVYYDIIVVGKAYPRELCGMSYEEYGLKRLNKGNLSALTAYSICLNRDKNAVCREYYEKLSDDLVVIEVSVRIRFCLVLGLLAGVFPLIIAYATAGLSNWNILRAKFLYQKYLLRTGCASLQESLSEEEKEYLLEFTDEIKEDVLEILMRDADDEE